MKKVIFLVMAVFLFASKSEYLEYTNKLITYHFKLNKINKIKSPFYNAEQIAMNNKLANKKTKKIIYISLISILNNTALVKIDTFIGSEKIKEYKKWIYPNSKIEYCRVKHIDLNKIILKCGNKLLIKKIEKKSLKIRVEK